jgi:thiol-disulfide isomerase/thioredoxin
MLAFGAVVGAALFLLSLTTPPFADSSALKVEPACPAMGSIYPDENTRELKLTYFPEVSSATLKDPKKLNLDVGINGQFWRNNTASVPFIRQEDGTWKATLTRTDKDFWLYLIFQVKDAENGQIDDNHGQYWDVVLCRTDGRRDLQGIEQRARNYAGYRFDNGIARAQDYGKAIAVIDEFMKDGSDQRYSILHDYWDYKVKQGGGDSSAWRKVSAEVGSFINNHQFELEALRGAFSFVQIAGSHLSADLYPKLMHAIDAIDPEEAANLDRIATLNDIHREKNTRTQADKLAAFIRKYPNASDTPFAAAERLSLLRQLHDVEAASALFQQLVQFDEYRADTYAAMASIYIENGRKLDEALILLDKAEQILGSGAEPGAARIPLYLVLSPDPEKSIAALAYWRGRAYLQQGKGNLALPLAQKALEQQKASRNYFLVAQAYESVGEKQKAVDVYLQALTKPSEDAIKEREQLDRLWITGGFGTKEQLDQKVQAQAGELFSKSHYVARLVDMPANLYEFTTTKGETFRSANLSDKTVVLNFWATWCAPCLPELPGFQDLQRKHPELLVATLAISSDREQIDKLIAGAGLDSLRVAQAPDSLKDAFVPQGVPVTYVIDHNRIRVIHPEALSNVVSYIEADLAAIRGETSRAKD